MKKSLTAKVMLALLTGCSVAFACVGSKDGAQCCAGQTPAFNNSCIRKTCEGGNRSDKVCYELGAGVAGATTCNPVVVMVKKTVVQYRLTGSVCNTGVTVMPSGLPDEFVPCTNVELIGICSGEQ